MTDFREVPTFVGMTAPFVIPSHTVIPAQSRYLLCRETQSFLHYFMKLAVCRKHRRRLER
jgi:hypothetical protein